MADKIAVGETLEKFEIAGGLVTFPRRFDNDHPELHYAPDPKVLRGVERIFASRGNKGDAAIVHSAIQALGGPTG